MRRIIAMLCLAMFCIALFAAASHYHGAEGPNRGCALCRMSSLSYAADNDVPDIYHLRIEKYQPAHFSISLPEAPSPRVDARGPPA